MNKFSWIKLGCYGFFTRGKFFVTKVTSQPQVNWEPKKYTNMADGLPFWAITVIVRVQTHPIPLPLRKTLSPAAHTNIIQNCAPGLPP